MVKLKFYVGNDALGRMTVWLTRPKKRPGYFSNGIFGIFGEGVGIDLPLFCKGGREVPGSLRKKRSWSKVEITDGAATDDAANYSTAFSLWIDGRYMTWWYPCEAARQLPRTFWVPWKQLKRELNAKERI